VSEPAAGKGAGVRSAEALSSPGGETGSRKLDEMPAAPGTASARQSSQPARESPAIPAGAPAVHGTALAATPPQPARNAATAAAGSTAAVRDAAASRSAPPAPSPGAAGATAERVPQTNLTADHAQPAAESKHVAEPAAATRTVAVPAIRSGTLYLQVLASKEAGPARKELMDLKAKGHPVTLDNHDPEWFRILVGPFDTREAASAYQLKLESEGLKPFLRKF
jgi:hypothetical protein